MSSPVIPPRKRKCNWIDSEPEEEERRGIPEPESSRSADEPPYNIWHSTPYEHSQKWRGLAKIPSKSINLW